MGETLSLIIRPTVLILATLLTVSISQANGVISTNRALVPYVNKQCPALFMPTPSAPKIFRETGFFDERGRPVLTPVILEEGAPKIIVADTLPIYSDKLIKDKLESGEKIQEDRKAMYEMMTGRGQNRFIVMPRSIKVLDHLYETMPNFKEALDVIKKSLAISLAAGEPVHIPNIILLGDPGLGKTRFANAVAKALGTGFEFISMNSVTHGSELSGSGPIWKGASPGLVAKTLIEKDYANPVIVVDEVDKAGQHEGTKSLNALFQLWEKDTAAKFTDEFVAVPIDASHINWIATANDVSMIPKPILDRATVIEVPKPTKEQMRPIISSIMAVRIGNHPKLPFLSTIREEVFLRLYTYTPRQVDKLIEDAIGSAVLAGRREIEPSDVNVKVLDKAEKKRGIGFLAEGY